jgi:glutathione peroxidase-family protein
MMNHTIEFNNNIKQIFSNAGCELLSQYINRRTKVKYKCNCGNVAEIRIDSFQAGTRCRGCLSQRIKDALVENGASEKKKANNLEKHGVEHYFKTEEFKEKSKKTLQEKYGVDNVSKNPEMKIKIKAKLKESNQKKFGVDFLMQSKEFREKSKQTIILKYGVDNVFKLPEIREKIYKTCFEKYGNIFPMKNKDIIEKAKKNSILGCLEKHGVPYIGQVESVKEKVIKTNLEKYNVEYTLQNPDIYQKTKKTLFDIYGIENIGYSYKVPELKQKIYDTCMKKYGTIYPMQNKDIAEKSMKCMMKKKFYTLPSGKQIEIQGYENFAFDALVRVYDENKILNNRTDMPEIWYCMDDGKYRYYYPDIYIPDENLIIEVKSPYTYYELEFKKTDYKRKAVEALGYKFKLLIFDKNGNLVN